MRRIVPAIAVLVLLTGCVPADPEPSTTPSASTPPAATETPVPSDEPTETPDPQPSEIDDQTFNPNGYPGFPPSSTVDPVAADPERAYLAWVEPGAIFAITLFGSSSCPPTSMGATAQGSAEVVATFQPTLAAACTADLAPQTYELPLPAGVDPALPLTVLVVGLDSFAPETLEP